MKKITWTTSFLGLCMTSFLGVTGCDSQVDGDYAGEPLATLHGTVSNERADTPAETYIGLWWLGQSPDGSDINIAETVEVSGEFPAQFRLDLYQVPPEGTLFDNGPDVPRLGLALIAVSSLPAEEIDDLFNDPDNTPEENDELADELLLGASEEYFILYSDRAVPAGTSFVNIHGPLRAGHNIMRADRKTPEELDAIHRCQAELGYGEEAEEVCGATWDDLVPVPQQDADVSVRMVDSFDQIDLPNLG